MRHQREVTPWSPPPSCRCRAFMVIRLRPRVQRGGGGRIFAGPRQGLLAVPGSTEVPPVSEYLIIGPSKAGKTALLATLEVAANDPELRDEGLRVRMTNPNENMRALS